MDINIDVIIYYIRMFATNICVYYCFEKMLNIKEKRLKNYFVLIPINLVLLCAYIPSRIITDSLIPFIIFYFIYTIIISKLTKNKLGYSIIVIIMAYAITFISQGVSVIIQFIPYKLIYLLLQVESRLLSLAIICIIQFALLYGFFKIKRFRNGFSFLNNKFNNEITDIIMINISTMLISIYCLFETYPKDTRKNLLVVLVILGITMFFSILKMLTMYYKQKLLMDTMEQYKQEIAEKQNEIEKLKSEKKNISKITHEFYNRQKALELLVGSNMNSENIDKDNVSPSVLQMIESLTSEYSQSFENIKELPKLELSDIPEIDNMFKYMQSECSKNNINFKLKIMGNIHSLVNNIIPKNKLETLIGDHLRDAINAVNLVESDNKEIMVILGIKNKVYELSIFDTGVDFKIETLLKLGLEQVTTNAERGGTGTGFMTTFETLKETNASLVITEYPMDKERYHTKCVTIKFDGKNQYRICSYRAEEIEKLNTDGRIKIEKNK